MAFEVKNTPFVKLVVKTVKTKKTSMKHITHAQTISKTTLVVTCQSCLLLLLKKILTGTQDLCQSHNKQYIKLTKI